MCCVGVWNFRNRTLYPEIYAWFCKGGCESHGGHMMIEHLELEMTFRMAINRAHVSIIFYSVHYECALAQWVNTNIFSPTKKMGSFESPKRPVNASGVCWLFTTSIQWTAKRGFIRTPSNPPLVCVPAKTRCDTQVLRHFSQENNDRFWQLTTCVH